MSKIFPFPAIMPGTAEAAKVAAPPYDVVNREEAAALASGNSLSFLRVSRSEIELAPDVDPYATEVYSMAAANYRRLCAEAPLKPATAAIFVYSLLMGSHRQTGLAATFSIDEYDAGIIKKHEKTRQDKEDDRTRHILALKSQTGPVFLTYRYRAGLDAIVGRAMTREPIFDFTAADGIRHTGWQLAPADVAAVVAEFANVPCTYIADGHHRAASAARVRQHCRSANPRHTGGEEYNRVLAVAFPDNQLRILPYNRVIKTMHGLSRDGLLAIIGKHFAIGPAAAPAPATPGTVHMYLDHSWMALRYNGDKRVLPAIDALDVSLLQKLLLEPAFGITDPRTSKEIDFVGGIRGTAELERLVDSGRAALAFALYPTTVAELMAIADAGGIMPPKSTWFEPKLRDGLFIHDI